MTYENFIENVYPLRHMIFRLALRYFKNKMEAEDIVQESMIKLWKQRNNIENIKNIKAFAFTIARNLCLDRIKSKAFKSEKLEGQIMTDQQINPHLHTEQSDFMEILHNILNKLPEKQKLIIQLRDIEHYDLKEIADVMSMTENNVRVSLSRARKVLRNHLNKVYNYEYSEN